MKDNDRHRSFMSVALELARKAKGTTFPNPAVGAIVVAGNKIVGKGATSPWGGPHAEKIALLKAGVRAKNAVMYVTLEPCCHFGKTPPCSDAIVSAGIKTVFISIMDPNPLVRGKGIRLLKKNGITVYSGLLSKEAKSLNEDFFWSITKKKPWITLKLALTLDGRIADLKGNSRWITSVRSRWFAHDLRSRHAAIVVGGAPLLRDDPRLSVRHGHAGNPARIVFSSSRRLPATSYFIKNTRETRSIIVIFGGTSARVEKEAGGLEIWHTGLGTGEKRLESFLEMAYAEGLTSILVEGGSKVASLFMEYRRVNRLFLFYGNKLLGKGLEGFAFKKGLPLSHAAELYDRTVHSFGDDIVISGTPVWNFAGEK